MGKENIPTWDDPTEVTIEMEMTLGIESLEVKILKLMHGHTLLTSTVVAPLLSPKTGLLLLLIAVLSQHGTSRIKTFASAVTSKQLPTTMRQHWSNALEFQTLFNIQTTTEQQLS